MGKINTAVIMVLLAVLFSLELNGQQQEEGVRAQEKKTEQPVLKSECQAVSDRFVKGQNVEIRCSLIYKSGSNLNFDSLKNIASQDFFLIEMSVTDPVAVPSQKDYNLVIVTEVLKPRAELKYGKYAVRLSLVYNYPDVRWIETNGDQKTLETKVIKKTENIKPIVFEKVSLFASVDYGEGFKDVVNIGEHIGYTIRIFYEKDAIDLLNGRPLIELEKKYAIKDVTKLDSPDLNPFVVINKDDPRKKKEIDHGFHRELIYNYRLALYDVNVTKMFEIQSLNIYFLVRGQKELNKLVTPVIKVRTNSVLNSDGDFRPMKGILRSDPEKILWRGIWPLRVAYVLFSLAGFVILYAILMLALRYIKRVHNKGFKTVCIEIVKSFTARLNGFTFVTRIRAVKALNKLVNEPNQKNLKLFINRLRLYLGSLVKLPANLALSHSLDELRALGLNAETLKKAEYLLDENVAPEDLIVLEHNFKELIKKIEEVGPWS